MEADAEAGRRRLMGMVELAGSEGARAWVWGTRTSRIGVGRRLGAS